jgi:peptide-methionine (S)-S-oxide reductase
MFALLSLGLSPAAHAPPLPPRLESATFAAGCFWGVEAAFRNVPGVVATTVGYTGGHVVNPTYRDVYGGQSGHVEAVRVTFDPRLVSYAELLDVFWSCHDPTSDLTAGANPAPHYSALFFDDALQESIARASLREVEASAIFHGPIVTRLQPAVTFYPAESFHQHYLERQHIAESCHVGVAKIRTRLAAGAESQRRARPFP